MTEPATPREAAYEAFWGALAINGVNHCPNHEQATDAAIDTYLAALPQPPEDRAIEGPDRQINRYIDQPPEDVPTDQEFWDLINDELRYAIAHDEAPDG